MLRIVRAGVLSAVVPSFVSGAIFLGAVVLGAVLLGVVFLGGVVLTSSPSFAESPAEPPPAEPAADPYAALLELKERVAAEPDSAEPYFYLGMLYSRMRQHDLALRYVDRALEIDGANNAYANLKGAILVELRRYRDALEAFRQALAGDQVKDPHKVWRNICYVHQELNTWDEALAACRRSLALEPDDPRTAYALGKLLLERDDLDEAIEHLATATRLQPEWVSPHAQLGIALARAGRLERAIESLSRAVELAPEETLARYNLAQSLLRQGRVEEGRRQMAEYEQRQRAAEELEHRRRELTSTFQTALARLEEGALDEAEALLRQVLELDPGLVPAHYSHGFLLLRRQDHEGAIRALEEASRLDPLNAGAYFYLAAAHDALGDPQAALEPARRAVAIFEDNADYQRQLAGIYLRLNRGDEALEHFRRAVELRGDEELHHLDLADALARLGRAEEAEQALDEALEAHPGSAKLHARLAVLHEQGGRLHAAAQAYERAVEQAEGVEAVESLVGLAAIYVNLNRFDDAVAAYRRALELRPDLIEAHGALGSLYRRRGLLAEAEAELRAVLEVDPEHVEARAQLAGVHLAAGRFAAAAEEARRALEGSPDHLQARYTLATALVRAGEGEAGREELAEYQRRLDDAQSHEHRFRELMAFNQEALQQLEAGDPEAAVALFRQAVEKFPDLALPHVTLGLALIKVGEAEGAIHHLSKALELGFDFPEIHRYLSEQYAALGRNAESERERATYLRMREELRRPPPPPTADHEGSP